MKRRWNWICRRWMRPGLGLAIVLAMPGAVIPAQAWTDDVRGLAGEVSAGNPSQAALKRSFANNDILNKMALRGAQNGGIPPDVYAANQRSFDQTNQRLLRQAANDSGLEVDIPARRGDPLPGTDTDVNFRTKDGRSPTLEQWNKITEAYHNRVNDYLGRPRGTPVNTNTDIMPDPRTTSPAEFQRITRAINESGGTAYTDPAAVRVELSMGANQPIPVNEVGSYVTEVTRHANQHFEAASQYSADANRLARTLGEAHPDVQSLRAEAQLRSSQGAKYIDKINQVGGRLRQQSGQPGGAPPVETTSLSLANQLRDARGADTIGQANKISALSKNALHNATQNTINELAHIARTTPEAGPACHQAMADAMRDLPPAQRGQAMEMIQSRYGNDMAKGVAQAAQGPTAGARVMNGFGKVMKVVGPGMMIWEGYGRISSTLEAKEGEERAYAAGKNIGGFVGGMTGAAAVGLGAMAVIGAPVTAVGAAAVIGVGLVAGAVGYTAGDQLGTAAASRALEEWRPRSQAEHDARAASAYLEGSKNVYGQLKAAGIPDDIARLAAGAYSKGDLEGFNTVLGECRKKLTELKQKELWKNIPPRRFEDLPDTELQRLLSCLCSKSLGAASHVAQGYYPQASDASPHCKNLGNGPCMASGFGCWRSFIKWSNPGIADCLAQFNVADNPYSRSRMDRTFQKSFEKPMELDVTVSPTEFCPGDTLTVEVRATGGRGDTQYRYNAGHFLAFADSTDVSPVYPSVMGPSSSSRVRLVAPEVHWGTYDGVPLYERGFESYSTHVTVWADGTTWDEQRMEIVPAVVHKRVPVRMRSVQECRELHPDRNPPDTPGKKPAAQKPGAVAAKPPAPPPRLSTPPVQRGAKEWSFRAPTGSPPTPGTSDSSAPPATTGSSPDKPQPATQKDAKASPPADAKKAAAKSPSWPAEPPGEPETPEPPPDDPDCWVAITGYGTFDDGNTFIGRAREGRRVAITVVSDADSAEAEGVGEVSVSLRYIAGDHRITVQDLDQPDCVSHETLHVPLVEEPAEEEAAASDRDCQECLSIGGSTQQAASSLNLPDGTSESTLRVNQTYYVEGCPGDRVRISVKGSDGWSDSAEAVNGPASVTRTFTTESGVDTVTAENLSIHDCSLTFERSFGPPQTDLRGAEAAASDGATTGAGARVLESVVGSKAARADQRTGNSMQGMAIQQEMQRAATSGDQRVREAQMVVDGAGRAAQATREENQRRIAAEDTQAAQVMSTAIMEGIGSGLAAGGSRLGTGIGEQAAGRIFDHKSKQDKPAPAAPAAGNAAPTESAPGKAKTQPKTKPAAGDKGDSGKPQTKSKPQPTSTPASGEPTIRVDALCPICGEMYNPNQPHQCAGAPKPAVQALACEICGKSPAVAVTTADSGRKVMCNGCQANHRCPRCGKVAMELTGASFNMGYVLPDGTRTNRWASISGVCKQCLAKWKQDQKLPP